METIKINKSIKIEIEEDEDYITFYLKKNNKIIGKASVIESFIDTFQEEELEYLKNYSEEEEKIELEKLSKRIEEKIFAYNISDLEIEEEYKRQKMGTKLLSEILYFLKKKGKENIIYLNASPTGYKNRIDIESLTKFYKKNGFEEFLNQGNNKMMIIENLNKIKKKKEKKNKNNFL